MNYLENRRICEAYLASKNTNIDEALPDIFRVGKFTNPKDKKTHGKFVIDRGQLDTWGHKAMLDRHGVRWDKFSNSPAAVDWDDRPRAVLNTKVKKVLEEIAAETGEDASAIPGILDTLEEELKKLISGGGEDTAASTVELPDGNRVNTKELAADLQNKLRDFKMTLMNITSSDEFKKKIKQIIGFRDRLAANGGRLYSFNNTILIMIQDPQATLVEAAGTWKRTFKRTVNADAKFITLCVKDSGGGFRGGSAGKSADKEFITKQFLDEVGKKSVDELNGIQKDVLRRRILMYGSRHQTFIKFKWESTFCDVRFTEPMPGTKDEYPTKTNDVDTTTTDDDGKPIDMSWYDDTGYPTKATLELAEAIRRVCKNNGIDFGVEDIRGGARGYSAENGKKIRVLAGATENSDLVKTMIHELTHSLCHWPGSKYAKKKMYGDQEQEAEMTAWLVSMTYGYEETTNTSINYMANWGLHNPEDAARVFDSMMAVVQDEVRQINAELDKIRSENGGTANESVNMGEKNSLRAKILSGTATGRDIASMLGIEAVYDRSKNASIDESDDICEGYTDLEKKAFSIVKDMLGCDDSIAGFIVYELSSEQGSLEEFVANPEAWSEKIAARAEDICNELSE